MKHYLNLPELIGQRIVKQINSNGDERIDHDEFVQFFLRLLMGTIEQRMLIAFRCYDVDDDQQISEEEVKIVLQNIPLQIEERYGVSHAINSKGQATINSMLRSDLMVHKQHDTDQINQLIKALFANNPAGIFFDEFVTIAEKVTSELFVCIFDCIYQCIPCAKNFLIMRANYKFTLQMRQKEFGKYNKPFTITLMPPVTTKMLERFAFQNEPQVSKNKQQKSAFFNKDNLSVNKRMASTKDFTKVSNISFEKEMEDLPNHITENFEGGTEMKKQIKASK